MAATACSLVQMSSDKRFRLGILAGHIVAGFAGGAVVGLILGALGGQINPSPQFHSLLIGVLVVAALWDLFHGKMASLQPPVGVPADWRLWQPVPAMVAYGLVLGGGVFTPFTAAAMYAILALVVYVGDPGQGLMVFAAYGGVRALASMLAAAAALSVGMSQVATALQSTKPRWRTILGTATLAAAGLAVAISSGA